MRICKYDLPVSECKRAKCIDEIPLILKDRVLNTLKRLIKKIEE